MPWIQHHQRQVSGRRADHPEVPWTCQQFRLSTISSMPSLPVVYSTTIWLYPWGPSSAPLGTPAVRPSSVGGDQVGASLNLLAGILVRHGPWSRDHRLLHQRVGCQLLHPGGPSLVIGDVRSLRKIDTSWTSVRSSKPFMLFVCWYSTGWRRAWSVNGLVMIMATSIVTLRHDPTMTSEVCIFRSHRVQESFRSAVDPARLVRTNFRSRSHARRRICFHAVPRSWVDHDPRWYRPVDPVQQAHDLDRGVRVPVFPVARQRA